MAERAEVTEEEVEAAARALCRADGINPDHQSLVTFKEITGGRMQTEEDAREDRRIYERRTTIAPPEWHMRARAARAAIEAAAKVRGK